MSATPAATPTEEAPQRWEPIPPLERRILGVLIEKQKTSKSPDAYPMTLNALTTGCNQKSNRDPVMELDDVDVENGLNSLQKKGFTLRIVGGRADRYRHQLYDIWKVTKIEMAILAELLLRGPQSEGDLRIRASRMDDIPDLETLRELLKGLVARHFVVYLTAPDRRGATLSHGFHLPEELQALRSSTSYTASELDPVPRATPAPNSSSLAALEAKLNEALADIAQLKEAVATLQQRFPPPTPNAG